MPDDRHDSERDLSANGREGDEPLAEPLVVEELLV